MTDNKDLFSFFSQANYQIKKEPIQETYIETVHEGNSYIFNVGVRFAEWQLKDIDSKRKDPNCKADSKYHEGKGKCTCTARGKYIREFMFGNDRVQEVE